MSHDGRKRFDASARSLNSISSLRRFREVIDAVEANCAGLGP
jgi:hypothetical protein